MRLISISPRPAYRLREVGLYELRYVDQLEETARELAFKALDTNAVAGGRASAVLVSGKEFAKANEEITVSHEPASRPRVPLLGRIHSATS
jgi:hypothetical protein